MSVRAKVATVYLLGFFIDLLNMFIVNIAYPDIAGALGAGAVALGWIGNAYLLGLVVVIPLGDFCARRLGGRRSLLLALLIFAGASLAAGMADSVASLIAWRAVQGLGGGLLIPIGQAMSYRLYPTAERAALTTRVMLVALLVPALSPALGGLLVDQFSWRWIFWLNLPLVMIALLLAARWLPRETPGPPPPLDRRGLLLAMAAVTSALLGLSWLGQPGQLAEGGSMLALAILLGALQWRDARRKQCPILRWRLLALPSLRTAMLVYLCVPGMFMGASLVLIFYLRGSLGLSASAAGALMLPWALGSCVAIGCTRRRFNRYGPRPLLLLGMTAQSAGLGLLASGAGDVGPVWLVLAYAMMGLGGSLCSSTAQSLSFVAVRDESMGAASVLWNINRQLGFCLGTALLGGLLNVLLAGASPDVVGAHAWSSLRYCLLLAIVVTLLPWPLVWRLNPYEFSRWLRPSKAQGDVRV